MKELILQANPYASYLEYKKEIDEAVYGVLNSGWYILGQEVSAFESEFSSWCGVNNSLGVNSGTDALVLALKTLDIGPGDIVLTVSHIAVATVAAIELVGATPFLVDIDPQTYTISPDKIIEAIQIINSDTNNKNRIKAIIPVHIYGHPADMDSIMRIAGEYGLFVIEDCAQAHGAEFKGRKVGTFGHMAEFSFYPTKNLGAFGDGGALVMNENSLYEKAKSLREYGWKKRYISDIPGMNSRLDELQAAILRVKLRYLNEDNRKRQHISEIYNGNLKSVTIPYVASESSHVYHQYVIRVKDREIFQNHLKEKGVMSAIHYPVPVHLQNAYKDRIKKGDLSITEAIMPEIVSLPIYSQLSINDVDYVCRVIRDYYKC